MSEIKLDKRNYRKHSERNKQLINKSLKDLGAGRSILIDNQNEIIAGNGVFEQARELNIPIKIIETDGTELIAIKRNDLATSDRKRQELAVMDNSASDSSEFDLELLSEDFNASELLEMGINIEGLEEETENEKDNEQEIEKNPIAEGHLNETIRQSCAEILDQYKKLDGFSFFTPHVAKIAFIKFLFYGKKYYRYNSLCFHKMQFKTNGDALSIPDALEKIFRNEIKVERLRYAISDDFPRLLRCPLPFAGARLPADFPADLARELIEEFGAKGKILDPCAGWGGRLVGFLASSAIEYQGIDASPHQVEGDLMIYDCYKDVVDENKKVSIVCSPFEKFEVRKEYYNMALTSPPYFDVEKYEGGEQSRHYGNYEKWKANFYSVLIKKVYDALKKDGVFCLQVGNQSYPLETDGIKLAKEIGFKYLESRTTQMINTHAQTSDEDMERVIIFQKL